MSEDLIKIGDSAPEVCLQNQDGSEVCLNDQKGKWVVLYFYPKDNTSGCTLEAKDFTSMAKEFNDHDAVIIGISPDSIESHKKFIAKHSLGLELLSDPDHNVLEAYGAWGKKKMYGREFFGVVRSTFLINPEGKIEFAWPKVKVKGHVDQVLDKLTEVKKK
jgi:peroxiredoxin Q/BCP